MKLCSATSAKRKRIKQWILIVCLLITWGLWIITTVDCSMILVGDKNLSKSEMNGYGLYRRRGTQRNGKPHYDQCQPYSSLLQEKDETNQNNDEGNVFFEKVSHLQIVGRVLAALGLVLHTITVISSITIQLCHASKKLLRTSRVLIVTSFLLFVSMVFLFFFEFLVVDCMKLSYGSKNNTSDYNNILDEDELCIVGPTGIVALINSFALLILMFASWIITTPKHPIFRIQRWDYDEEKTEREEDDSSNEKKHKISGYAYENHDNRWRSTTTNKFDSKTRVCSEMSDDYDGEIPPMTSTITTTNTLKNQQQMQDMQWLQHHLIEQQKKQQQERENRHHDQEQEQGAGFFQPKVIIEATNVDGTKGGEDLIVQTPVHSEQGGEEQSPSALTEKNMESLSTTSSPPLQFLHSSLDDIVEDRNNRAVIDEERSGSKLLPGFFLLRNAAAHTCACSTANAHHAL